MAFNVTVKNISVISWQSVLLLEKTLNMKKTTTYDVGNPDPGLVHTQKYAYF
jgi:hypothetical protein